MEVLSTVGPGEGKKAVPGNNISRSAIFCPGLEKRVPFGARRRLVVRRAGGSARFRRGY